MDEQNLSKPLFYGNNSEEREIILEPLINRDDVVEETVSKPLFYGNNFEEREIILESLVKEKPKLEVSPPKFYNTEPPVSFSREVAFGQAQEPMILGSLKRIGQAAFASLSKNETYEEARKRIEDDRQEKIFEEFAEFRGKEETAGVITGRMSVALADPITFFIPWAKFAKAGKVASLTAGGSFAAADMALREEALYGEIKPTTVALGFGLGVVGAQIGDMAMAAYAKTADNAINEVVVVSNKTGGKESKPVKIKGAQKAPAITKKDLKKAEEITKKTLVDTEESLVNLGTLGTKINTIKKRRLEIKEEIKKAKRERAKFLTKEELKDDDYLPMFIKNKGFDAKRKKLTVENKALNQEIKRIHLEEMSDNVLDIVGKNLKNGVEGGVMNSSIARGIIQEATRPLFGGIIGGAVGAANTEEGEDNTRMLTLATMGAFAGKYQKFIQTQPYELVPKYVKDAAGNEVVETYRRSFHNFMKGLTAGSHVQELFSFSNPVVTYALKMFKAQGGGVKLGKTTKELSVEEEATLQLGAWKNRYSDLVGAYDDDVLLTAGKLVNQKNLKSKKYSFLNVEDEIKLLGKRKYNKAVKLASDIDDFTLDFKKYATDRGLDFNEEAQYGLTQILNKDSIGAANFKKALKTLSKAFYLQNSKEVGHRYYKPKGENIAKAKKHADNIAGEYLYTSTHQRRESIWAKEIQDTKYLFQGNSIGGKRKEDFVLNAARHFNKERTLYDQEARALASKYFEQNPEKTLNLLINNTINVAEFSKRFGSKGEGIKKLFTDIDNDVARMADPSGKLSTREVFLNSPAARQRAEKEKAKIKDSLEAWFGVYHADKLPSSKEGEALVTFLQTGLATTRLTRVAIPSLGDLLQTITNSGWKASFNGAISEIKLSTEGLGLKGKRKQIKGKDVTFIDRFRGDNLHDNIVERELKDVMLLSGGNLEKYQQKSVDFTRRFFEVVQLGRVTRIARNWAFDSGVARAMDISKLVSKGRTGFLKSKDALQKEMDTLGLNKENFKYLSQFDTLEKAIADPKAKLYLKQAGLKSADRDALVPTVGNRRLFAQSKNPYVKFTGSFLSWAQAKTSQTNALVSRVENGDAALFLRMMAAVPLFMGVREAQVLLSPSKKYKETVEEETKGQKIAEGVLFTGLPTVWVEKLRNLMKYGVDDVLENIAPVLGYMQDISEILLKPLEKMNDNEADKALDILGSVAKETAEVVPFGKRAVSLIEGNEEEINIEQGYYSTGGLVKGKDDVPYTKEDAADRINKYTGKPYSDQMNRLGLADGGGDMTRVDGTQKSSQGWLGPIKNNVTGKDMTEVSMGIGPEDNQKLIPLLVPTLTKKEIEILKNMKIEGNIKNIPQSVKEKAIQHARKREEQGLNIFYNGE
tara:strand:+ start:441 stop:4577 length:4137 start_codon:yes stop_codon:yes gene_type:complete